MFEGRLHGPLFEERIVRCRNDCPTFAKSGENQGYISMDIISIYMRLFG